MCALCCARISSKVVLMSVMIVASSGGLEAQMDR